jgi:hypothetical protein
MKSKVIAFAALLLVSSIFALDARATVLRVVTIQTDNADAYLQELGRGQALIKKLGGSAVIRAWRARFAGPDAGTIVVSIEYPDMITFANDEKKVTETPEYQEWLKGLAKVRKVLSDSLYDEMKP